MSTLKKELELATNEIKKTISGKSELSQKDLEILLLTLLHEEEKHDCSK